MSHDWTVFIGGDFGGWKFGVAEYENVGSVVYIGSFMLDAQLSAPAVAGIAAAGLVVLVGLAAFVISKTRSKPAPL